MMEKILKPKQNLREKLQKVGRDFLVVAALLSPGTVFAQSEADAASTNQGIENLEPNLEELEEQAEQRTTELKSDIEAIVASTKKLTATQQEIIHRHLLGLLNEYASLEINPEEIQRVVENFEGSRFYDEFGLDSDILFKIKAEQGLEIDGRSPGDPILTDDEIEANPYKSLETLMSFLNGQTYKADKDTWLYPLIEKAFLTLQDQKHPGTIRLLMNDPQLQTILNDSGLTSTENIKAMLAYGLDENPSYTRQTLRNFQDSTLFATGDQIHEEYEKLIDNLTKDSFEKQIKKIQDMIDRRDHIYHIAPILRELFKMNTALDIEYKSASWRDEIARQVTSLENIL